MSVSFRPHMIRLVKTYDGHYNEHGDFIQGSSEIIAYAECRYEPNGKAQTVSLGDGRVFMYSYTVYLDTDCPDFNYGDTVELLDDNDVSLGLFTVLGFHRGQLNAKLWV